MARFRITITSRDREMMLDLVRKRKIQVDDHSSHSNPSGGYSVDAFLEPPEIEKLRQAGYHVDQHEDVDKTGKARQKEVGQGDRYKQPDPYKQPKPR